MRKQSLKHVFLHIFSVRVKIWYSVRKTNFVNALFTHFDPKKNIDIKLTNFVHITTYRKGFYITPPPTLFTV